MSMWHITRALTILQRHRLLVKNYLDESRRKFINGSLIMACFSKFRKQGIAKFYEQHIK